MRWAVCFDIGGVLLPDYLRPAAARWDPDLVALVRGLRGRAATALVSNAWPQMRDALARAGLTEAVDAVILSCEVGQAKPDARIYRAALGRLGVAPGDALFVDDTPGHVAAAEALGMAGHVHTDATSTTARIEAFTTGACWPPTPSP